MAHTRSRDEDYLTSFVGLSGCKGNLLKEKNLLN
jgi:hypothetical protein